MIDLIIRILMDWVQIFYAVLIISMSTKFLCRINADKARLSPWRLRLVFLREQSTISPKKRIIAMILVVGFFAIIQFSWTIMHLSSVLDIGEDFRWFVMGMLVLHYFHTDLKNKKMIWAKQTSFREEGDCPTNKCTVCEGCEHNSNPDLGSRMDVSK